MLVKYIWRFCFGKEKSPHGYTVGRLCEFVLFLDVRIELFGVN